MILHEDMLSKYSGKLFYSILLEYLTKTDKILHAQDFFEKEREDTFDLSKRDEYVKEYPVKDIKKDLFKYVKDFIKELNTIHEIERCEPDPSTDFGFSDYIYLYFNKPENPDLEEFYNDNQELYRKVKVRFSDHKQSKKLRKHPERKAKIYVNWYRKNFIQASQEMMKLIQKYIDDIHAKERQYLSRTNTNECFKLQIAESVSLDERLEDIGNSTYCTDSAQDIANWIVNKPMPYRVIYDKKYDVWCIADAEVQTHKDMSIDMFDSNYLYGIAKDLDNDIELMRKEDNLNDGWTDAEVYSDYQFDHYNIKGLIFIPENMEYRDYEESGFYSAKTELVNGTIFTTRHSEFSDSGIFKSLYLKLKIMGAIKPEIEALWKKALLLKFDSDKMINWFYDTAGKHGYSDTEISRFIDDHLTDYLK